MKTEKRSTDEFVQGIAVAAASIAREFDQPSMASQLVHGFGYSFADLRRAGADEYDLQALRGEMLADEKYARSRDRRSA